ncbi:MAG: ATP-binding cassette domain-containing protein [candidate division NC10 bacterium]|nr:ATP-binding cassette domain-containing protein [candidate division NC10 bacterium]
MIQIENISKSFGGQVLFRDLTWHIARGQRIGLVGPNGAGKTTLCRILTGQMEVDSGQVRRAKSATIGYLPQEIATAGHPGLRPSGVQRREGGDSFVPGRSSRGPPVPWRRALSLEKRRQQGVRLLRQGPEL